MPKKKNLIAGQTGRYNRLSCYKTKVVQQDCDVIVTYQSTQIVKFNSERIVLNFGGWDSVTTRRKMNQASKQYDLGFSVYRKKGETYISFMGKTVEYSGHALELHRLNGEMYELGRDNLEWPEAHSVRRL